VGDDDYSPLRGQYPVSVRPELLQGAREEPLKGHNATKEVYRPLSDSGGLVAVNSVDFTLEKGISSLIGATGLVRFTFFSICYWHLHPPLVGCCWKTKTLRVHRLIGSLGIARTFPKISACSMSVLENVLVGRHSRLCTGLIGTYSVPCCVPRRATGYNKSALTARLVGLGPQKPKSWQKPFLWDQRRLELHGVGILTPRYYY